MNGPKKLNRWAAWALMTAGVIGASTPSYGYRMIQNQSTGRQTSGGAVACNDPAGFAHWNIRYIPWFNNPAGQGSGKAPALEAAMQSWTDVTNAAHKLSYQGQTTAGFFTDNINTISWGLGNGCSGSCLALTALVLDLGQVIVESDITFNEEYVWRMNGTDVDTQAVATHELGHSLGIHHSDVTSATMYPVYFGTPGRTLEADDQAALSCSESRYPVPNYQGNFEGWSNCRGGGGWAWDSKQPVTPIWVDLFLNNSLFEIRLADEYRSDLQPAGIGNGYHAFNYTMPPGVFKGPLQLRAIFHGTATDLNFSPKTIYCRMSLFDTLLPADPPTAGNAGSEFGVEISSAISGYIMGLKFYKAPGETGSHVGRVWSSTGQLLASVNFVNETASGWQGALLSNPVPIQVGQRYRVSYTANTYKSKTSCGLSLPVTNYPLTAHYGYTSPVGGTFPNTQNCNNFFVDVRFDQ
jgi:Domain of unknown function (DUF4082)/Matrixin